MLNMTKELRPEKSESADYFIKCDCDIIPEFNSPPSPVKVIDYYTYKHNLEEKQEKTPAFSPTPQVHQKYNGNVIHSENYPLADLVCPECGKRYSTETIVEQDLNKEDKRNFDGIENSGRRVSQSVTVVNELPDISDMWRVMKDGDQIDIAETREEAKEIVQNQYPIDMDLDWSDEDDASDCMVNKGDHTADLTHYKVKYTHN